MIIRILLTIFTKYFEFIYNLLATIAGNRENKQKNRQRNKFKRKTNHFFHEKTIFNKILCQSY